MCDKTSTTRLGSRYQLGFRHFLNGVRSSWLISNHCLLRRHIFRVAPGPNYMANKQICVLQIRDALHFADVYVYDVALMNVTILSAVNSVILMLLRNWKLRWTGSDAFRPFERVIFNLINLWTGRGWMRGSVVRMQQQRSLSCPFNRSCAWNAKTPAHKGENERTNKQIRGVTDKRTNKWVKRATGARATARLILIN